MTEIDARNREADAPYRLIMEAIGVACSSALERLTITPLPELRAILQDTLDRAVILVGAELGALGILEEGVEQRFGLWISSGVLPEDAGVDRQPSAVGLLGAVIRENRPIRVADVAKDPRFRGLPPGHPPISSFLGIPVHHRGRAVGNLYVARRMDTGGFSELDQQALELLSRHLGFVIEQHRLRKSLEAERARLDMILQHAPHGIMYVEAGSGRVEANPEAVRIFGAPLIPDAKPQQYASRVLYPDGRPVPAEEMLSSRALRGEECLGLELEIVRANGKRIPVLASATPLRDAHGQIVGGIGMMQDITERKRMEEALSRLSRQNVLLLEAVGDGIYGLDPQGNTTFVNPAAARMLGWTVEELIGAPMHEVVHHSRSDCSRYPAEECPIYAAIRDGEVHRVLDEVFWRRDGTSLPVEYVSTPVIEQGRIAGAVIAFKDVTQQRAMQAALRRSEERFRLLAENARDMVYRYRVRPTRGFEYVSPSSTELTGYPPEAYYANPDLHLQLMAEDYRPTIYMAYEAGGTLLERPFQSPWTHKDGRKVWIEVHRRGFYDDDGNLVAIDGIARDITERKQIEEQLAAERSWLTAVIHHSPVGILLARSGDAGSVIANRRAGEILGRDIRSVDDITAYPGKSMYPDGRWIPPQEMIVARALRGETVTGAERLLLREDGVLLPLLVSAGPIRDSSGNILGAVATLQDISAMKELERRRQEWTSVIAHDLRQPIQAIMSFGGLLLRRVAREGRPDIKEPAEHVLSSARLLNRMITDLLDLECLEAQRLKLEPRAVDLTGLVRVIVERAGDTTSGHPVRVTINGPLPLVRVDPGRLEQVLGNLLSNAAKYGYAGTPILIGLEADGEVVRISVTNQGEGIPPDELPKLFSRFHRTRGAREGGVKGLGLGLYISTGLVQAHGGRLWVESVPGEITTFRFTLPVPRPEIPRSSASDCEAPAHGVPPDRAAVP